MGYYEKRDIEAAEMIGWVIVLGLVTLAVVIVVGVANVIRGWLQ